MTDNPIKKAQETSVERTPASNALKPAAGSPPVNEQKELVTPVYGRSSFKGPKEPINDTRYQCHTAPSTFQFRDGTRFMSPDGIIYASTEEQEAELQDAVAVGNLSVYDGKQFKTVETTPER